MSSVSTSKPSQPNAHGFFFPDFWKMCPFPAPGYHKDGDLVSSETREWFTTHAKSQAPHVILETVFKCSAGELAAKVYPPATSRSALRLISDFLLTTFIIDDLLDLMDDHQVQEFEANFSKAFDLDSSPTDEPLAVTLIRDWWARVCLHTTAEGWKTRMISLIKEAIEYIKKQAENRVSGRLSSLDEYVHHRRLTSGVIPAAALIEFGLGMELPDEVLSHPLMRLILDCTNDFVYLSNDVFSYGKECKTSDTHNMLIVLQKKYGMDLQSVADHIGFLAATAVKTFQDARAKLPSFGPKLDKDVAAYCEGLEMWFIGQLDWSFICMRYLDDETRRDRIRETLWIDLED